MRGADGKDVKREVDLGPVAQPQSVRTSWNGALFGVGVSDLPQTPRTESYDTRIARHDREPECGDLRNFVPHVRDASPRVDLGTVP
jgi:hypothetical protein